MTCGFLIQLDGYTLSGELEKDVFRLVTSVGQRKKFELGKEIEEDVFSSRGLRIFPLSHARDKTKNIFLYFFNELKTYHLSYFSLLNCLQCILSSSYYVISWS